ncbi:MAG: DUF4494 family protein [Candidatus Azobacteroides sp.]|nr:DUF4494 family protein [Candidatus Azobacteroides sp.]
MELIKRKLNVCDAEGWYLMQDEFRYWSEDIADGDTGEMVSIERNKILIKKGARLTLIDLSTLRANGIKDVYVSNVPLKGNQEKRLNLWETVLKIWSQKGESKKTYIVTAECPAEAEKYISEWHELNVESDFELIKVNKFVCNKIIKMYDAEREEYEENESKRIKWYKCQLYTLFDEDGDNGNSSQKITLCQAANFEKALKAVKFVLGKDEYESVYNTFKLVQEQKIEEVFIPDEKVNYYSEIEL